MLTACIKEESGKKSQFSPGTINMKLINLNIEMEKNLGIRK